MWAIAKKEFKQYFLSPIGYCFIGVFLLICSLYFYIGIFQYQTAQFTLIFSNLLIILFLTFMVPILTMRTFSEERKNGTEILLLTSPRSVTSIVLGKFLAAAFVVLIATFSTLVYYFILKFFAKPQFASSIVSIIGISLLALAYVSFGMFASSITENQVIAAVVSIGFFILTWLLPNMISSLSEFSLIDAFGNSFIKGTISIANLVLLISFIVMFLLFTIMVLQRRKLVK